MDFEIFKNRLQQKQDDAASFAVNKDAWKEELKAESSDLVDTVVSLLDELVAASLVKISRTQQPAFWPSGDDPELVVLMALRVEYDGKSYFLLPDLIGRGISGKAELQFYGSTNLTKKGRHGPGLAFHDGQWYWTSDNRLTQPLSKDTLAKALM